MSDKEITVCEPEIGEWDSFVANDESTANLFHSSMWMSLFDNPEAAGVTRIIAFRHNDQIIGGVTYLLKSLKRALIPLLSSYSGIVYDKHFATDVVTEFLNWAKESKFSEIILCIPDSSLNIELLKNQGFTCEKRQTYIVDVSESVESLWAKLDNSKKRQIRKAERSNITISFESPNEDEAFALFENTFLKHGENCPITQSLFRSVLNHTNAQFHCAYKDTQLMGFVISHLYKKVAYYTVASASEEAKHLGIPSLLVWQTLCHYAKREDADTFDFMGANIPSIAKFKEGFSPTLKNYYIIKKSDTCIKLSKTALALARRLRLWK